VNFVNGNVLYGIRRNCCIKKRKKFNYVDIKWNKYFRLKLMENKSSKLGRDKSSDTYNVFLHFKNILNFF
jgi:hypothetical protein